MVGLTRAVRKRITRIALALSLAWTCGPASFAADPLPGPAPGTTPIHWSSEKTLWDRRTNVVELIGNAVVDQPGESIRADHILLNRDTNILDARGNCLYLSNNTVMWGEEMHVNLDTRTGTIIRGRVATDTFTLTGDRINKLSQRRFQTHKGEYTTCQDCPSAWTFQGEDVDIEFEAYAYMSSVVAKIKGTPVLWFPYLILPLKTQRQSGFLFPRITWGDGWGFTIKQPYFWAVNKSMDMTFVLGEHTRLGPKGEFEFRQNRLDGEMRINAFYLHDIRASAYFRDVNDNPYRSRYGISFSNTEKFPTLGLDTRLIVNHMSDNRYSVQMGDVGPGGADTYQLSELDVQRPFNWVFLAAQAKWIRHTAALDPVAMDYTTVQTLPYVGAFVRDRPLFGLPLAAGISAQVHNFTRAGGVFDYDSVRGAQPGDSFIPGVDPIRKALRVSLTPRVYASFRLLDVISVVPSLEYRGNLYSFPAGIAPLAWGYPLFQTHASFQLEKVYNLADPDIPRMKHLVRPTLTYSLIPYRPPTSGHPFLEQIANAKANGLPNYYFDSRDVVPYGTSPSLLNFFAPLGHSITWGLQSQLIRRFGKVENPGASYSKMVDFYLNQTVNLLGFDPRTPAEERAPLSRLNTGASFAMGTFSTGVGASYEPTIDRASFAAGISWTWEQSVHQKIYPFQRSIQLSYGFTPAPMASQTISQFTGSIVFSVIDQILPSLSWTYDFNADPTKGKFGKLTGVTAGFQVYSGSRCWRFATSMSYNRDNGRLELGGFELTFNLTGQGYSSLEGFAEQFVKR